MLSSATIEVRVPATTANIGPGFDCLGAALTRYNRFRFTMLTDEFSVPSPHIQVLGAEASGVTTDKDNLVYKAFASYFQQRQQAVPSIKIQIELGLPLARGLGSSATAIVAGLMGANELSGAPLSKAELLLQAIALEGHPDNVAPAMLGGCQLAAQDQSTQEWTLCKVNWVPEIVPIVAIPNFELLTQTARQVLPKDCSYAIAIFNTAHLGLLIKGLETGRADWLRAALQDQLHQPHRLALIPGYAAVTQAASEAGAYGVVISGAGPTLLALGPVERGDAIATAMNTAWSQELEVETTTLALDLDGAIAVKIDA
ncbi:MAG: homoserine kinase [Thermosynechococcaceae cyanobacterium]